MILPITLYGNPVLRRETQDVEMSKEELAELIANMFETMYSANGVGLAAPQVGMSLRLFVIDSDRRVNHLLNILVPANLQLFHQPFFLY